MGTNAKTTNLSKTTLGNGGFAAASGIADALGIETTTQKYSAAICTTAMQNISKGELIFTGTNGGAITQAWVLSSTDGTTWEIESTKKSSITTGTLFSFTKNSDSRQYAFVSYWNLTNSGGLKGFEFKLYGEYPTNNDYEITYNLNGGTINNQSYTIGFDNGDNVTLPDNVTKKGYNFLGWYDGNGENANLVLANSITETIELYAKWEEQENVSISSISNNNQEYKIKGEVVGAKNATNAYIQDETGAIMLYSGDTANLKIGNVVSVVGTYDSNYSELKNISIVNVVDAEDLIVDTTPLSASNVLIEENRFKYTELNNLRITNSDTSSTTKVFTTDVNNLQIVYTNQAFCDGYSKLAVGNYVNIKGVLDFHNSATQIVANKVIDSTKYTVTYHSNGGTSVSSQTVVEGSTFSEPQSPTKAATSKIRYTFAGWYQNEELTNPFSFSTIPNKDYDLYAKWSETEITVDESFILTETKAALSFDYIEYMNVVETPINDSMNKNDAIEDTPSGNFKSSKQSTYADGSLKLDASNSKITYTLANEATSNIELTMNYKLNGQNAKGYVQFISYDDSDTQISASESFEITATDYTDIDYEFSEYSNVSYFEMVFTKSSGNLGVNSFDVNYNGNVKTYDRRDFSNLSLRFKYDFDFTGAVDLLETGIFVTTNTSLNTNEVLAKLPSNGINFVNTGDLDEYIVSLNNMPINSETCSITVLAVGYVKTSTGYHFNVKKVVSVDDIITLYKGNQDALVVELATNLETQIQSA